MPGDIVHRFHRSGRAAQHNGAFQGSDTHHRQRGRIGFVEAIGGARGGQLVVDDGGRFPLTVLGSPEWVSNGTITENGNAALALSTLSAEDRLVVLYPRPDPGDADHGECLHSRH